MVTMPALDSTPDWEYAQANLPWQQLPERMKLMDFTDVVKARRSIRKFKTEPIPEAALPKLYEALSAAPSGNNGQPCSFVFVRDPALRAQIVNRGCHQESFLNAPLIVVASCRKDREFDCAIAVDHLILAAANEGLGSCWVGWIERDAIREIVGIPKEMEIPVIIPIGYADEKPAARPRKPLAELIHTDTYK